MTSISTSTTTSSSASQTQTGLPYIAVFGATGQQGGSVVRHLLATGRWWIKAITRDKNGDKAKKLKEECPQVEIEECDMCDRGRLNSVLQNCLAVFCVTDFYTERNLNKLKSGELGEVEEGKCVADACKQCGVKYLVLSTLMNAQEISRGRFQVAHFTGKNLVEQHAKKIGLNVISILPGFFMQNVESGMCPSITTHMNGTIEWQLPLRHDVCLPLIDISQLGIYVVKVLQNPDQWVGKYVLAASEYLTMDQMAAVYAHMHNTHVIYHRQFIDEYTSKNKSLPFVKEFAEMLSYFNEFGYYEGQSLAPTLQNFGRTRTWREWLLHTGWTCSKVSTMGKITETLGIGGKAKESDLAGQNVAAAGDASKSKTQPLDFEGRTKGETFGQPTATHETQTRIERK